MLPGSAQAIWRPCLSFHRKWACSYVEVLQFWEKPTLFRALAETTQKASSIKTWHVTETSCLDIWHCCCCFLLVCLICARRGILKERYSSKWLGYLIWPYKGLASAAASLMCSCLALRAITRWNSWGTDSMVPICVPESGSFWLIIQFSLYAVGNNSILALEKGFGLDWNIGLHNFFSSSTTNS